MLDGMSAFVPENAHELDARSALDLEQLESLEPNEPRMSEVEWNGDSGNASRGEPFVGEPSVGPDCQAPGREFLVQLLQPPLQWRVLELKLEILEPKLQQPLCGPCGPRPRSA